MLDYKEFTAVKAREIAKSKKQDVSLETTLTQIMAEANKGGTTLIVQELSEDVIAELRIRGFEVGRLMYRTSFQITWR